MKRIYFGFLTFLLFPVVILAQIGPNSPNDFEIANSSLGGVVITGYIGTRQNVVIPDTIDGFRVTEIGSGAFRRVSHGNNGVTRFHTEITSIILPNTLIEIGFRAFYRQSLTSISFPNSLRKISSEAFLGNRFSSIVIPNGITYIGNYAFSQIVEYRSGNPDRPIASVEESILTSIVIPPSLINYRWLEIGIEGNAFSNVSINRQEQVWLQKDGPDITRVTLPANMNYLNFLPVSLSNAYNGNSKRAGTYIWNGRLWVVQ